MISSIVCDAYYKKLFQLAWEVYSPYFNDQNSLLEKLESINDGKKFLQTTKKYYYLVFDVEIKNRNAPFIDMEFVGEGYKLIAIISIIESLYSAGNINDFHQWLMKRNFPIQIEKKTDLDGLYKEYIGENGCKTKVYLFFSEMQGEIEPDIQENLIIYPMKRDEEGNNCDLKHFTDILYEIRSKYLHQANQLLSSPKTKPLQKDKVKSFRPV